MPGEYIFSLFITIIIGFHIVNVGKSIGVTHIFVLLYSYGVRAGCTTIMHHQAVGIIHSKRKEGWGSMMGGGRRDGCVAECWRMELYDENKPCLFFEIDIKCLFA